MTVFLTFDDGPSENTTKILKILKKHHVKATFFVTGKEGDKAKKWYQQIAAAGHTLGMHSYSHSYSTIYESVDAFDQDFTKLYDYIEELTGVSPEFYRFPGGSSNQVSNTDMNEFIDYLGEKGMTYYDWNVVCGDATSQIYTADELVENVMTEVVKYKYSVVLMHDAAEKDTTVDALEKILQELEEMDATVLPITEDSPVIHHNLAS
jgi:peptidoglycan/xylan/chitin deacetylase (PgdA/CDA1 family)